MTAGPRFRQVLNAMPSGTVAAREGALLENEVARFHVAAVVHYTTERPDGWIAVQEAEAVRSSTTIGTDPGCDVTYFESEETEGGEG